ncbi:lipase member I-like [Trichogramma pretiosum]|uniref:lipase member I-like n=1 Tax=Trichogramma pretiosum TaxID=7493 RepID=UPI0006C9B2AE|nr:lipase member I-like [Trichogramma pretiosum]
MRLSLGIFLLVSALSLTHANIIEDIANWPFSYFRNYNCSQSVKDEKFSIQFRFINSSDSVKNESCFDTPINVENITNFDPRRETKVMLNPYFHKVDIPVLKEMKSLFSNWPELNIIMIDWTAGGVRFNYEQAAFNTISAAEQVQSTFADLIAYWEKQGVDREEWGPVHFLGISLAAHVSGQAARLLQRNHNFTIARITGLDPAEPCFEPGENFWSLRLTRQDADFVDIIHSDASEKHSGGFGMREAIGHVDFYLDGGNSEGDCSQDKNKNKRGFFKSYINYPRLTYHALVEGGFCRHMRAANVFVESLKNDQLRTVRPDCQYWGVPWGLEHNASETERAIQAIDDCTRETCPEVGINSERFFQDDEKNLRVARNESVVYYVSLRNRSDTCVKYFSNAFHGVYSNHQLEIGAVDTTKEFLLDFGRIAADQISNYLSSFV